jgi:hypothetical protein
VADVCCVGGCGAGACARADKIEKGAAKTAAEMANTATYFGAHSRFARRVEMSRAAFKATFRAARIGYMSRKLRIIWWPPSVSTLSG